MRQSYPHKKCASCSFLTATVDLSSLTVRQYGQGPVPTHSPLSTCIHHKLRILTHSLKTSPGGRPLPRLFSSRSRPLWVHSRGGRFGDKEDGAVVAWREKASLLVQRRCSDVECLSADGGSRNARENKGKKEGRREGGS